jgi:hypothetical protein
MIARVESPMPGLIALIAVIVCAAHSLRRGDSWPMAILMGVKHSLVGMIAIYGSLVVLVVGVGTARAILHPVTDVLIALSPDTQPPASRAGQLLQAPTEIPAAATQPPPTPTQFPTTPTPRAVIAHAPQPHVRETPIALSYEAAESPTRVPTAAPAPTRAPVAPPTPTPAPARTGCDPAYPDAETCIPPGPPWDQGCAITDERRFTVLPPDPQSLDHDEDGIGCEPVS